MYASGIPKILVEKVGFKSQNKPRSDANCSWDEEKRPLATGKQIHE